RRRLVPEPEALPVDLVELGIEAVPVLLEPGGDRPVLFGDERTDLVLALDDEAQRDRLDAPGREPGANRLPEERADLIADQAVQDTARLLRLDLAQVDDSRVLQGAPDRVGRDLVEQDAAEPAIAARLRLAVPFGGVAELLGHVEGDGLSFPIRVRG